MGIDVESLATLVNFAHYIWDYPLRIIVVLYMLYQTLGYSSFAGVALLLLNTFVSARIARVVQGLVKKYTNSRNREAYNRDAPDTISDDVLVSIDNGTFKWLSTDEPTLRNVSIQCKRDELVAVIGKVGAGKSSLVSAMLGDMIKCDGSVRIRGNIAYVPQQAWIINATLRDNILFGIRFDQEFYNRVIDACALRQDLGILPGGDMTEIGEKGINLSGGQKARVSLARAVYARADVYILDDPLAAVDAHVGKHIFTHVLGPQGMLKSRARILITNAVQYLSNVAHIVMLHEGAVLAQGSLTDIAASSVQAQELICYVELPSGQETPIQDISDNNSAENVGVSSQAPNPDKSNHKNNVSTHSIIKKEAADIGAIEWDCVKFYIQACGIRNVCLLLCAAALTLALNASSGVIEDRRPSESWPGQGMVEFKDYSTRYREGLDLVLKGLSFRVLPNQKVGIVGRTGAGKSSLTLALFRIIEAAGGQILLDGEDISKYGLFDVRSKLSIIPQDPVLFAGTVRENLDPFNNYSDQDIWQALEHAHLADVIRAKDERLEFLVTQSGENFSVGQRQLICLARALLKRAKVLVLDEATAAIDNATDTIIQESIRKEFKHCTVLTIAHRLNTIIDSDMILVVDGGKLAEYDTPQNLLENENSLFAKLVEEAKASDS
ncbi:hypothetical protein IWW50_001059 [Coemansia erecta]|nr:hypothetical protein IWW50_001059 [Coemansia erecta]